MHERRERQLRRHGRAAAAHDLLDGVAGEGIVDGEALVGLRRRAVQEPADEGEPQPAANPVPKKTTCAPKVIAIPVTMNIQPKICPMAETRRVEVRRSPLMPQRIDRSTRPPSSGNAGIRLKTPMTRLMGPSHARRVSTGPSWA